MLTHRWVPLIFVGAGEEEVLRLSSQLMMILACVALGDAIAQNAGGECGIG
jgi:hypothetical protein